MKRNSEKTASTCLEFLTTKLTDIQASLPNDYRNDIILQNELLNAVKVVDECRLVYHKPSNTVQGVIYELHASLATSKRHKATMSSPVFETIDPSAHFIDCSYLRVPNTSLQQNGKERRCIFCEKIRCCQHTTPPGRGLISSMAARLSSVCDGFM